MRKIFYSKAFETEYSHGKISLEKALRDIKRDIILFDQIVLPELDDRLENIYVGFPYLLDDDLKIQIAEFEYLKEEGLIRGFSLFRVCFG